MITVFGAPGCQQCRLTRRGFARAGTAFVYTDVTEEPEAMRRIKTLGHTALPVVVVEQDGKVTQHWSGLRPDLMDSVGGGR